LQRGLSAKGLSVCLETGEALAGRARIGRKQPDFSGYPAQAPEQIEMLLRV